MKSIYIKFVSLICMCLGLFGTQLASAADNAVALGITANPIGSIKAISYERMVAPGISVGGRFSNFDYDYWDGSYNEWGSGSGMEVTAAYHFNRKGFEGPYLGIALGQVSADWSWYDSTAVIKSGSGTSNLTSVFATFGWDFVMKSGAFVLRPSVMLGSYSGSGSDNTGTKSSKLGAVAGVGVSGMFAF